MVEHKDKMLEDLEFQVGKSSYDLNQLQRTTAEDKELADGELSRLHSQLAQKSSLISQLRSSTDEYKRELDEVLSWMQKKVFRDDVMQAMSDLYQNTRSDNQWLVTTIKSQEEQHDEMYEQVPKLQADLLQAQRSSDEKDSQLKEVQRDLLQKEAKIDSLQMETERLEHELEGAKDEKERCNAEAKKSIKEVSDELERVRAGTVGDAARNYILRQREEKDHFRGLYQQVREENHDLRQTAEAREEQAHFVTCLGYVDGAKQENVEARLKDAEKLVETLRDENHRLENLPHAVHISKVLKVQAEFEAAREEIHRLEKIIREEDWHNGNGAYQTAVDTMHKLKVGALEMLELIERQNNANQAGEPGEDFDEVYIYIEQCRELLNNIPSCDPDDEGASQERWMPEEAEEGQELEVPEQEDAEGSKEFDTSLF